MYTYQIVGAWNHVDLSGAASFDTEIALFPEPVEREGLLYHASEQDIREVVQCLADQYGPLDEDDCQGVCQRCERLGLWVTRGQVEAVFAGEVTE